MHYGYQYEYYPETKRSKSIQSYEHHGYLSSESSSSLMNDTLYQHHPSPSLSASHHSVDLYGQTSHAPPHSVVSQYYQHQHDPVREAVSSYAFGLPSATYILRKSHHKCNECNLVLTSKTALDMHLAGARHARKLKELELNSFARMLSKEHISKINETEFKCELCNVLAASLVQLKAHVDGMKHRRKMGLPVEGTDKSADKKTENDMFKTKEAIPELEPVPEVEKPPKTTIFTHRCTLCGVSSNSQFQFQQHLASRKHANKASKHMLSNRTMRTLQNNFVSAGIL